MKDLFDSLNDAVEYSKKVESILNAFHKNGIPLVYKGGTSSFCAASKKIIDAKQTKVIIDLHDNSGRMQELESKVANPGTGWQTSVIDNEFIYLRRTKEGKFKLYLRVLPSHEVEHPFEQMGYFTKDNPDVLIPFNSSEEYEQFCTTHYTASALNRRSEKVEVIFLPLSSILEIGGIKYGGTTEKE